jgi:hypothetical protein
MKLLLVHEKKFGLFFSLKVGALILGLLDLVWI